MLHFVVIGGGIAGLSAAYYLVKQGEIEGIPVRVTVFERDRRWGGKIITECVKDFVIEGGPDTFLVTKPWGIALCRELGLSESLQGTNTKVKNTYILKDGLLHPLPEGLTMMVPTLFSPMLRTRLLTWPEKARMGLDYFIPPRRSQEDESLGSFVSRRLGRSAYENLIEPLLGGIYAGDGDSLSLGSTFPQLRDLELQHGGLIKGALALRSKMNENGGSARSSRSVFVTPTGGLGEMVDALVSHLKTRKVALVDGIAVESVTPSGFADRKYRVGLERGTHQMADGVVLATPSFVTADLVKDMDPLLADEMLDIPFVSTATVSLAYPLEDIPRELDGYGYIIPRREGHKALACTWTSTKFPHRSPEGYALLRVFIGRAGQEDQIVWDEQGLKELAREELRATLGIEKSPVLERAFVWERAMPQYNLGHSERLLRIANHLGAWPGLALAGNSYTGIGIPDCIRSGELAAQDLLQISK